MQIQNIQISSKIFYLSQNLEITTLKFILPCLHDKKTLSAVRYFPYWMPVSILKTISFTIFMDTEISTAHPQEPIMTKDGRNALNRVINSTFIATSPI